MTSHNTSTEPTPLRGADEANRLKALERYTLNDVPASPTLERITHVAARLFDTPISLITLIDRTHQHYKACYGIDLRSMDRELTFCIRTIRSNEVLVSLDTQTDPRFSRLPHVTGPPYIRFYAGAPLISPDGYRLGTVCVLDVRPHVTIPPDGPALLASLAKLVVDEFELRYLARALREAHSETRLLERLAAIGTLVASVGHEINNPLTYIFASVDFARRSLEPIIDRLDAHPAAPMLDEERALLREICEAMDEAREGSERIGQIVTALRYFGRSVPDSREPTDVGAALEFALRMAHHLIRYRARLERELEDLPAVRANKTLLSQLFVNLLTNAAQAIEPGHVDTNTITVRAHREGGQVVVEICDSGEGIPPEILPRIFDPFFTTKSPDEGTGLGLPTCLRIARELGGDLELTSSPGKGTCARVRLPALAQPPRTPAAPAEAAGNGEAIGKASVFEHEQASSSEPALTARSRVLLIDDEPRIGEAFERLLRRHVDVTVTTDAADALERLAQGQHFDVIFCDLLMPRMTGLQFFEALRQMRPDLTRRFVFITGGSIGAELRRVIDANGATYVYKPFSRAQILETIDTIVHRADGPTVH